MEAMLTEILFSMYEDICIQMGRYVYVNLNYINIHCIII